MLKLRRSLRDGDLPQLTLLAVALVPSLVAAQPSEERPPIAHELVAEALFVCDALPPGGRDLNLSLALQRGEPDPLTGEAGIEAVPRLQLAMALGERVGFTVDAGLSARGDLRVEAPGASLKVLLRDPAAGAGLAASVDLYGSTHALADTEAGIGLGAIRAIGPLTLRASASAATGVSAWTPHVHGGVSAAAALGARLRVLGEAVAEVSAGRAHVSAGPTLKVALGEGTALMAGALLPVSAGAPGPVVTFQLSRSL